MNFNEVIAHYHEELLAVEKELLNIFQGTPTLLPTIGYHIINSGGKRLRPLFLLLSADLCGSKSDNKIHLAAIIEAIHTASLLHDDVIDRADTRRGKPSANSKWGNQIVILVGDYLYSNALRLAVLQKNQKIMETLSFATTKMTEAEILQLEKTADPDISIEDYYKIISGKTAVLISSACKIGAIIANQSPQVEDRLMDFGKNTGIAFQLVDDVLDYSANPKTLGKKLGKDLEEGKITMPLISLLKNSPSEVSSEVRDIVKNYANIKDKKTTMERIRTFFSEYKSIDESMAVALDFINQAKECINIFEPSITKQRLIALAEYSLKRQK